MAKIQMSPLIISGILTQILVFLQKRSALPDIQISIAIRIVREGPELQDLGIGKPTHTVYKYVIDSLPGIISGFLRFIGAEVILHALYFSLLNCLKI